MIRMIESILRPSLRRLGLGLGLLGLLQASLPAGLAEPHWPPVTDLASQLRTLHPDLPHPSAGETNPAAYLKSLAPLVLTNPPASPDSSSPPIVRSQVYPQRAGYLRLRSVDSEFASSLKSAVTSLVQTGSVAGLVLDLRFASGSDFSAAATAAGLFADHSPEPLRLGASTFPISTSSTPLGLPVILLVHRQTRGAAEALAAAVRSASRRSLIIGSPSAGEARSYRRIPLGEGLEVSVAGDPLLLPGGEPFPVSGLPPDLLVPVDPEDEARFYTNEFAHPEASRSVRENQRFRLNEAELVRRMRGAEGRDRRPGATPTPPVSDPAAPAERPVQDPVLARALDLIAGYSDLPSARGAAEGAGDSR